jgi:chromate transporter
MLGLVSLSSQFMEHSAFDSIVHGLKLLAVVVVADAALGMYNNFCKNKLTVTLCLVTAIALLISANIITQIALLLAAASLGAVYLKGSDPRESSNVKASGFKPSYLPLILFVALLVIVPFVTYLSPELALFNDFYQAGSLVFGGGHVVLPLLQNIVGDQLSHDAFITGYAAAQAVPGPMFTFATYIGYELLDGSPILGAMIATLAVFLPGFLLLLAVLKNWQTLASNPYMAGALSGVNAAVVGLLIAALYQPIFTSAVSSAQDMAMIVFGIYLLKHLRLPIVWLVVSFVLLSLGLGYFNL